MPTLLLNYVYYNPVGHVVEALKVAKGIGLKLSSCEICQVTPFQIAAGPAARGQRAAETGVPPQYRPVQSGELALDKSQESLG